MGRAPLFSKSEPGLEMLVRWLPWVVVAFWLIFLGLYEYRQTMDDGHYLGILENRPGWDPIYRPIHHGLLFLQGRLIRPSMADAMKISVLLHGLLGWMTWRYWICRFPDKTRVLASLGLFIFLVHPIAIQTAVHVAQRAEILGLFFCVMALQVDELPLSKGLTPSRKVILLFALAVLALLSKESYVLLPALLLGLSARKAGGGKHYALLLALIPLVFWASSTGEFFKKESHSKSKYERSAEFRRVVSEGRIISNENSLVLPNRDPMTNFQLQVALIPLELRILFFPYGMVREFGHFPYGKNSYRLTLPWLWIGTLLFCTFLFSLYWAGRRLPKKDWSPRSARR